MVKQKILIASIKSWNIENAKELKKKYQSNFTIKIITEKNELNLNFLQKFQPEIIFFPHWSWKIPKEIYESYECIIFHMTDLPYGRGGTPLQNLIVRGHTKTKISAIKCVESLDAGPIYFKEDLSLLGTAEAIFLRASKIIFGIMIPKILTEDIEPKPQKGKTVKFSRRKPEDGDLSNLNSLSEVFDCIRMLDAENYPPAFLRTKNFVIEFSRASLKHKYIKADVVIKKRKDKNE